MSWRHATPGFAADPLPSAGVAQDEASAEDDELEEEDDMVGLASTQFPGVIEIFLSDSKISFRFHSLCKSKR